MFASIGFHWGGDVELWECSGGWYSQRNGLELHTCKLFREARLASGHQSRNGMHLGKHAENARHLSRRQFWVQGGASSHGLQACPWAHHGPSMWPPQCCPWIKKQRRSVWITHLRGLAAYQLVYGKPRCVQHARGRVVEHCKFRGRVVEVHSVVLLKKRLRGRILQKVVRDDVSVGGFCFGSPRGEDDPLTASCWRQLACAAQ